MHSNTLCLLRPPKIPSSILMYVSSAISCLVVLLSPLLQNSHFVIFYNVIWEVETLRYYLVLWPDVKLVYINYFIQSLSYMFYVELRGTLLANYGKYHIGGRTHEDTCIHIGGKVACGFRVWFPYCHNCLACCFENLLQVQWLAVCKYWLATENVESLYSMGIADQ